MSDWKPYNDLEDHDRSVARDRLAMAAWEAAQEHYDNNNDDIDYDDVDEDEDEGCFLCGRRSCMGYCES